MQQAQLFQFNGPVAGVDEAGRGPPAGPVVAAAVILFGERSITGEAIVGGDAMVPAISAASIIAKTTRDRIMTQMDELYPGYEFARHKGYGTEVHRARLREHGPCEQHRRSFAPVRMAG